MRHSVRRCRTEGIAKTKPSQRTRRRRSRLNVRTVGSVVGLVGIVTLLVAGFAGGGGGPRQSVASSPPAGAAVPASARDSCSSFDQATGRLAAKDDKGFIDAMTAGATAAQAAASVGTQWQAMVSGFASFADDLAASNAPKVFSDLAAINQLCAAVRGPRPLTLNG
jgi:hypothetical protein